MFISAHPVHFVFCSNTSVLHQEWAVSIHCVTHISQNTFLLRNRGKAERKWRLHPILLVMALAQQHDSHLPIWEANAIKTSEFCFWSSVYCCLQNILEQVVRTNCWLLWRDTAHHHIHSCTTTCNSGQYCKKQDHKWHTIPGVTWPLRRSETLQSHHLYAATSLTLDCTQDQKIEVDLTLCLLDVPIEPWQFGLSFETCTVGEDNHAHVIMKATGHTFISFLCEYIRTLITLCE